MTSNKSEQPLHPLIYEERYRIRGYDADVMNRASVPAMIRIMHDAAIQQILDKGLSALQLLPMGLGWVLSHQHLEIFDRPILGDQIRIQTHPAGMDRVFTYREYQLFDAEDQLLAQSTTTWILMDIKTRKIAPFPSFVLDLLEQSNALHQQPRAQQDRIGKGEADYTWVHMPGYFELDFNGHVSNNFFFRWMLSALPYDFLVDRELTSFNVKLKGEAFAKDEILSQIFFETKEKVVHRLIKNDQIIATGISIWKMR